MNVKKVERMRYKNDSSSRFFCLLAILINAAYFIAFYTSSAQPDVLMGIDVLYNIVFMLVIFWASVKLKAYRAGWTGITITAALLQIARVFIIVLPCSLKSTGGITNNMFIILMALLASSAFALIVASIISLSKMGRFNRYYSDLEEQQEIEEQERLKQQEELKGGAE